MTQVSYVTRKNDESQQRLRGRASSRALTTLSQMYRDEYRLLYQALRATNDGPRQTDAAHAKYQLARRYPDDYKRLYAEALERAENENRDEKYYLLDGDR